MKYMRTFFFILAAVTAVYSETAAESEMMVDRLLGRTNTVSSEESAVETISEMDFTIESMTLLRDEGEEEYGKVPESGMSQPITDIGTGDYARVEILDIQEGKDDVDGVESKTNDTVKTEETVIEKSEEKAIKRPVTIPLQGSRTATGQVEETTVDSVVEIDVETERDVTGATVTVETTVSMTGEFYTTTEPDVREEVRAPRLLPGTLVGKVTSHKGTPLAGVKVVLFSDDSYHSMKTTPGGNFGFNILMTNEYTLTASFGNEFFYTNLYLIPAQGAFAAVQFIMPITVYGKLFIDDEPAQHGMLLRFINNRGAQAGGIVLSNGLFTVKRMTPGRYVMVCERRKRFIDNRINEQRFYYTPMTVTTDTMRIEVTRDRRKLRGQINIDGLPRRYVDAIVIMKDDRTGGLLIHREVPTYYEDGVFEFNHVQPGRYRLQAVQRQREWVSREVLINIPARASVRRVTLDVITDPDAHSKYIDDLKKQFLD